MTQKLLKLINSWAESSSVGKEYYSEVIRLMPVEARAAGDENMLFTKQIKREFFVIGDVEFLGVELGEDIEGTLGLCCRYTVNGVESVVYEISMLINSAAGLKESVT